MGMSIRYKQSQKPPVGDAVNRNSSVFNGRAVIRHPSSVACPYEFHVPRRARDTYAFDAALFSSVGRVVLEVSAAARPFAAKISLVRGAPVPASDINAM